jgi:hypothetical protein
LIISIQQLGSDQDSILSYIWCQQGLRNPNLLISNTRKMDDQKKKESKFARDVKQLRDQIYPLMLWQEAKDLEQLRDNIVTFAKEQLENVGGREWQRLKSLVLRMTNGNRWPPTIQVTKTRQTL